MPSGRRPHKRAPALLGGWVPSAVFAHCQGLGFGESRSDVGGAGRCYRLSSGADSGRRRRGLIQLVQQSSGRFGLLVLHAMWAGRRTGVGYVGGARVVFGMCYNHAQWRICVRPGVCMALFKRMLLALPQACVCVVADTQHIRVVCRTWVCLF